MLDVEESKSTQEEGSKISPKSINNLNQADRKNQLWNYSLLKKKVTKKKFDDYIEITSDDNQPLHKILSASQKKKKKSSPIVKNKQDKV